MGCVLYKSGCNFFAIGEFSVTHWLYMELALNPSGSQNVLLKSSVAPHYTPILAASHRLRVLLINF